MAAALTPEQLRTIAALARLAVGDDELPGYARDLSAILDLAAQMDAPGDASLAAELAAAEPLAHPLDMVQRLRDDVPADDIDREKLQAGAPALADGLYLVPQVIE